MALSPKLLAVGAFYDDVDGNQNAGSAYLFRRETNGTITELAKLTDPDGLSSDYFGSYIAVGPNLVAFGAIEDDVEWQGNNYTNAGSVTLYKVEPNGSATRTMK